MAPTVSPMPGIGGAESLMGNVLAFCSEKSCRPTFAPGTAAPPCVRSTENDNDHTSLLKSEFAFESAFAKRATAGYTPGVEKIPFANRSAQRTIASNGDVEYLKLGSDADPLRMRPRRSGRCCCAAPSNSSLHWDEARVAG
jgi:hypothetical protein